MTYFNDGRFGCIVIDAKSSRDAEVYFKRNFKEELVSCYEDTEDMEKRGAAVYSVPDDFQADYPQNYKEMEVHVKMEIEGSWDFVEWHGECCCMTVGIQGKNDFFRSRILWISGEEAEERTWEKARLEAESLYEITYEDAVSMKYSDEWEDRDIAEQFFWRIEENKNDFWEAEYMAAMDEPETEDNIKKLASDLWKQWKEYELDE